MIAVNPSPANAPANVSSAGASSASAAPASPFDAILTLEALAATCAALDTAPLGGGALEGAGLEDLEEAQRSDNDDTDEDSDGPLAFLVNLMNFSASIGRAPDGGDAGDDAIDDVLSGAGGQRGTADPAALLSSAANADTSGAEGDAAAKLLLAGAAGSSSDTASTDAATQDQSSAIARAAEWLAQGPRHAAGTSRDTIATPVHSPRWADDISSRVAMMVRGAESTASLQLTPVDLGPVEVNVTVRDSQATIHFSAAQAETRALLEASLPRLREMLASQGFNLLDASVSQGFTRHTRPDVPGISRGNGAESEPEAREAAHVTALGLLDTYA